MHKIEEQIAGVLDWYRGCDAVPETLANINRDLASIELGVPYVLRASFESDQVVVRAVPWTVS